LGRNRISLYNMEIRLPALNRDRAGGFPLLCLLARSIGLRGLT
jgi:hypothetical protein